MKRPLEVLHVMESLAHGGAEQNLLSMLRRLPPDRFRHHLAWLYDEVHLEPLFRPHVASLIPLHAHGSLGLIASVQKLEAWLRHHRPDVIHTQLLRAQLVARAAGFLARVPVVTTWQNASYDERAISDFGNSRRRRTIVRWLDGVTGRFDAHFIAVSRHVAEHCSSQFDIARERVSIIYNSVEPLRYQGVPAETLAETRRALGLDEDTRVLLSVGRLVPQKGQADLIEAMPAILSRAPRTVLLVAGGGPLRAELQAQANSLTLGDRVRLLGARRDMAALYQLADVFVFPSRYEGLSVALVEALANGLPAVVSDIPQNREVGDGLESVHFIPLGRVPEFATAVAEMLEAGPQLRAAAMAARRGLRERFSPEALAERVGGTLERFSRRQESEARVV